MGLALATHLHRCRGHLLPHPLPARTPSGPRSWLYSYSELVSVGPLAPTVPHNATSPTLHEDSCGTAARGRRMTPLFTLPTHRALPLPNATPTPCTETQTHVFQEGPQCPQRPTCSWPAAPVCPCWEPAPRGRGSASSLTPSPSTGPAHRSHSTHFSRMNQMNSAPIHSPGSVTCPPQVLCIPCPNSKNGGPWGHHPCEGSCPWGPGRGQTAQWGREPAGRSLGVLSGITSCPAETNWRRGRRRAAPSLRQREKATVSPARSAKI